MTIPRVGLRPAQTPSEARHAVHTDPCERERQSRWNDTQELQDQRRIKQILR